LNGATGKKGMRISNQGVLMLGVVLFVLGLLVRVIPIEMTDAYQFIILSVVTMAITIIFVASGITFIVIALVKQYKGAKQGERELKCANAALMSTQAQAEFNRRLARFSTGGVAPDEITQAKLFAQAVQTFRLEAPSSAVFADLNEMTVTEKLGVYIVTGWVDSQNFYGVMIRTPFTLGVFKGNGTWHVDNS
jgi:hypothetical protein